jgi:hypothetical protein
MMILKCLLIGGLLMAGVNAQFGEDPTVPQDELPILPPGDSTGLPGQAITATPGVARNMEIGNSSVRSRRFSGYRAPGFRGKLNSPLSGITSEATTGTDNYGVGDAGSQDFGNQESDNADESEAGPGGIGGSLSFNGNPSTMAALAGMPGIGLPAAALYGFLNTSYLGDDVGNAAGFGLTGGAQQGIGEETGNSAGAGFTGGANDLGGDPGSAMGGGLTGGAESSTGSDSSDSSNGSPGDNSDSDGPGGGEGFAVGGEVVGPGGPTDDEVPAQLSDGEYVMNNDLLTALAQKLFGQPNPELVRDLLDSLSMQIGVKPRNADGAAQAGPDDESDGGYMGSMGGQEVVPYSGTPLSRIKAMGYQDREATEEEAA